MDGGSLPSHYVCVVKEKTWALADSVGGTETVAPRVVPFIGL
jgi:hypothetical protein